MMSHPVAGRVFAHPVEMRELFCARLNIGWPNPFAHGNGPRQPNTGTTLLATRKRAGAHPFFRRGK